LNNATQRRQKDNESGESDFGPAIAGAVAGGIANCLVDAVGAGRRIRSEEPG